MANVHLTQGFKAVVDDDDFELVRSLIWQVKLTGKRSPYAVRIVADASGARHPQAMHRFILGVEGREFVDHRNGDGLDNRRANLRVCSARQNAENRTHYAAQKRARGGYLGVCLHKQSGLWQACIHAGETAANGERKKIYLGYYRTADAAGRVYDAAARLYFGEFAALNFPDGSTNPAVSGQKVRVFSSRRLVAL